jgi:PAS domain S-box-containing protein
MRKPSALKRRQHEFTLAKFGELALTSNDLDEILTEACRLVGDALGTDLAKVMALQADGETLLVRAGVGWRPGVVGVVTLKAAEDTSEGHALKTGEPMISPDIDRETRFTYPAFLTDHGVKAVANVLVIGGKDRLPFGILQIDSRTPRAFTGDDIAFLRSYANLLAAAVDRLRVVGEVRDSEARLRLALEAGELGSWDIDLFSGAVTRTPRHDQIFGYPGLLPAWDAKTLLDHVVPEDRDEVANGFRHAVDSGTEWHFECRIRRAGDGEVRWIEGRGRPYGMLGNNPPTRLLGIVADITERKLAEAALLQSNEMLEARVAQRTYELTETARALTEANARLGAEAAEREQVEEALRQAQKMEAVGQLTGGLAHDFNNLLQGISGSLELVHMRVAQGRTEELGRYIETAMSSAHRAAMLTQRLLAFSRRQTLDPKPTDLNRLAGGMEELLRRTVGPAIQIETSFAAEPWPTLCDPHQLESALLNLVLNARDAMPDGGHLLIETVNTVLRDRRGALREQPPQHVPPGDYVALSVADTGVGMAPEVSLRAFDPFFTTKPIGQGTGLGLSMIHGFIQQSGGHVRLRSEEGQGTTVTIYLPRHAEAVGADMEEGAAIRSPAAFGRGIVLLVEDEPDVRLVVSDILTDLGYSVLEAESGRAGLVIADSGVRIDLLLTDVGLPGGMNGRQLADAARQRRPDLKVLFITGYADAMAVGNGHMEQGMQVMTKPFGLDTLASRVQGIIGT